MYRGNLDSSYKWEYLATLSFLTNDNSDKFIGENSVLLGNGIKDKNGKCGQSSLSNSNNKNVALPNNDSKEERRLKSNDTYYKTILPFHRPALSAVMLL